MSRPSDWHRLLKSHEVSVAEWLEQSRIPAIRCHSRSQRAAPRPGRGCWRCKSLSRVWAEEGQDLTYILEGPLELARREEG